MSLDARMLPADTLLLDGRNARKSSASDSAIAEMEASICAHGVLVPLLVVDNKCGDYSVLDGGRRLNAVRRLQAEGELPPEYSIPCRVLDGSEFGDQVGTLEISLGANVVRENMHPVDEFEAFSALHDGGAAPVESIAARFGKTALAVRQSLALGSAHPVVREACRAGEIPLDALKAFCSSGDQERQLAVYELLKNQEDWGLQQPWKIKELLLTKVYTTSDGEAKVISLDDYIAAGGRTEEDLFAAIDDDGDDDEEQDAAGPEIRLLDADIVDRLVQEAMEAEAQQLRDDGWGWAEVHKDYSSHRSEYVTVYPKNRDKGYSKAEKKKLGAVVTLSYQGTYQHLGLTPADEAKAAKKAEAKEKAEAAAAAGEEIAVEPDYSKSLAADLQQVRLAATKMALSEQADRSELLSILHFSVCWRVFSLSGLPAPADIIARPTMYRSSIVHPDLRAEMNALADRLDKFNQHMDLSWIDAADPVASYRAFATLPQGVQEETAAAATILTLETNDEADYIPAILKRCDTWPLHYWRPGVSVFSRIKRADRLLMAKQILGEEPPPSIKSMKSDALSGWLADKARLELTADELNELLPGTWLPSEEV